MPTHAPYNFVPISNSVFFPDWENEISHDTPVTDGYCGTINLILTNITPLIVGGSRRKADENIEGDVKMFQTPGRDAKYAIPGSSIRGMIRNVLEIASFAKLDRVNNPRLNIRDTNDNRNYINKISQRVKNQPNTTFISTVKGGFLRKENGIWRLQPYKIARIEHRELGLRPNEESKLKDKYKGWQKPCKRNYSIDEGHIETRRGASLKFAKAKFGNDIQGHLVFTNQIGRKHREFVFYGPYGNPIELDIKNIALNGFLKHYQDDPSYKYLTSSESPHSTLGIPVFFIESENEVTAISLSQMVKIPATHDIKGLIANSSEDHANIKPDLAEIIFGYLPRDGKSSGLKSRAHFGLATLKHLEGGKLIKSPLHVSGQPNASFYPNYLQQAPGSSSYNTHLTRGAKIKGWKRYPARTHHNFPENQNIENKNIQSKCDLVPAGSKFSCKLHLHNLNITEIGALLWTLTFGNRPQNSHILGKGKAFGLGLVNIEIEKEEIISNFPDQDEYNFDAAILAFEQWATGQLMRWNESDQIKELLALTHANYGDGVLANHPNQFKSLRLESDDNVGTFKDVKKLQGHDKIDILKRHSSFQDFSDEGPVLEELKIGDKVENITFPISGEVTGFLENGNIVVKTSTRDVSSFKSDQWRKK